MKKADVKVGKCYAAKVSGHVATVRIDAENPRGGWDATNLRTKKKVRIKSAQRLRHETRAGGKAKAAKAPEKASAPSPEPRRSGPAQHTKAPKARKKRGGITEATKANALNAAMQAVAAEKKRASGLDAAAQVLAEAKGPMNTKEMVERMLAKGLWQTTGKTPAPTIYAAVIREIREKGKDARFRKVERGTFALAT